jgi:prolipoprotein diacylglyceryl transferase
MFNSGSVSILGITFHIYGLIVGIALVVGMQLIEYRYQLIAKPPFTKEQFWKLIAGAMIFGIIGARLWHVVTDWHLYQGNLKAVLEIWKGGLSILGAVAGGMWGSFLAIKWLSLAKPKKCALVLFDLVIFGLPIAQAVGRLGNFVNQELYGLPTTVPWAIFIDAAHRVAGFESYTHFHPLFLYEAILTASFGIGLWWLWFIKSKWVELGSGKIAATYLLFYSVSRFFLEFIRIEKTLFWKTSLGFNQVILVVVALATIRFLVLQNVTNTSSK